MSDRMELRYSKSGPIVTDPDWCAELVCQISGGPREMPRVSELVFSDKCKDVSWAGVAVSLGISSYFFIF